jgi:hypothetical protein
MIFGSGRIPYATVSYVSNTTVIPCTKIRNKYNVSLLHFSVAMRPADELPGQTGIAMCGMRGVVDQERVSLAEGKRMHIHELRHCRSCREALDVLGLLTSARIAVGALIKERSS